MKDRVTLLLPSIPKESGFGHEVDNLLKAQPKRTRIHELHLLWLQSGNLWKLRDIDLDYGRSPKFEAHGNNVDHFVCYHVHHWILIPLVLLYLRHCVDVFRVWKGLS
ncbi:uncharacterized protein [Henckelia pumila]|uniref:uncharacterized protein n=1 Tax=Henckelia pumila TaxID=405737 RepID=UPI003C6E5FF2